MENEPQDAYLPDADADIMQPFDVRAQAARGGMIKLVGAAAFVIIIGLVVLKLFASGTRDRNQTPRILADNAPYKEMPVERGGEQTPNQDKEIYKVLNGTATETTIKTVPVSEEPLPKPVPKPLTKTMPKSAPKQSANVVIKDPASGKPDTNVNIVNNAKTKPTIVTPTIRPRPVSGNYVVQVGSLRSQAEAATMWKRLSISMSGLITSTHYYDIKQVDLGSRGIYYRLRVSGLADKIAAKKLCSALKARNQECIVTLK